VKLQELFGTAGASASALDATAERLGISIDDLKIRIENAAQATRALNQGTAGAKQSLEELDSVAESAFEGIAKTLGTKFAFQVREEIAKVEDQLAKIGPTAQVGFAEAQAKAEQLRAKLQELRAEEERLRLGLPELGPVARESLGVAIESATELAQGLEAARVGTANVTSGFAALGSQAAASATQVAALAAQVQATALRSGGAAAVSGLSQAQIDSLRVAGVLSNSGRVGSPLTSGRVRLPGGGSRLVSSFGVSSGVFGRSLIGRSSVSSDGRITSLAALDGI
jgi:chaperonin cofactor prefoldin